MGMSTAHKGPANPGASEGWDDQIRAVDILDPQGRHGLYDATGELILPDGVEIN